VETDCNYGKAEVCDAFGKVLEVLFWAGRKLEGGPPGAIWGKIIIPFGPFL
jgi:hypothetical protein